MAELNVMSSVVPINDDARNITLKDWKKIESDKSSVRIEKIPEQEKDPAPNSIYDTTTQGFLKFFRSLRYFKIEVVTFIYMFAYIIRSVSSMTMIMDKVCRVHMEYPDALCDNIHDELYKAQKKAVQTLANNYHLGHSLIQMVPAALMAPFIGPWSDIYGRKLPLIVSLIGIALDGVGSSICAIKMDSRVEFYLLPAIFSGLSGGFISVFTVVYSYVTDTTSPKYRTIKYAILEMSIGLGAPLGQLAGGWIFKFHGYVPVFATSVAGHIFGLLWVIFILEETRGKDNKDPWKVKIRRFFSTDRLMESVRATIKERPHRGRMQIWLILLAMSMCVLALLGTAGISYLYTFHHYSWGNTEYSTVSSIFSGITVFVMLIAVPVLTRVLKVGDPILGIIGITSSISKYFLISMASTKWLYFVANSLGLFSGLSTLAGRSRLSKIVSKDDLGKVFSFLTAMESLVPIAASAIITQVFNSTIGMFPDPSYLGLGSLLTIALAVYIWMGCLPSVSYDDEPDAPDQPEEKNEKSTELT